MQTYTLRGIQSMLGLSRTVITRLIAAGFVTPARGKRREYLFGFQDVVLLRTAHGLQQARIPSRKILRSLQRLRSTLPAELPLTGLRISAVGNEIVVSERERRWHADSGQLLLDFELRPEKGTISVLGAGRASGSGAAGTADTNGTGRTPGTDDESCAADPERAALDWFERGVALETEDPPMAETAYRKAIEATPAWVDPYLNLGVMLCEAGRHAEAEAVYREGLRHCPDEALLHFNLAVALEDLDRTAAALQSYETCLRLAPKFADAHFNVARLHETLGHATKAIRHYSEYRRLQRRYSATEETR